MLSDFEKKLGYSFQNKELLKNALTHSSYANEHRREGITSNERLEFLGDAILGLVVAEHLYKIHPDKPEGELTKLRAELVCEGSLAEVAARLELGKVLRLGHGREPRRRKPPALHAGGRCGGGAGGQLSGRRHGDPQGDHCPLYSGQGAGGVRQSGL